MKWIAQIALLLFCLATTTLYFFDSEQGVKSLSKQENPNLSKEKVRAQVFKFPLYFEKNEGQVNENVKYLTRGKGYTFYFTPESIVISLEKTLNEDQRSLAALNIKFIGAKQDPLVKGIEEQSYKTNYFIGNEPSKWHANVPTFEKVCYEELYPGIDAVFYGNKQQLEYDLWVAPGSDPQEICLQIEGMKKLSLDFAGNLHIRTEDEQELLMQKPIVYQIKEGGKVFLEGNFVLLAHNEVGFALGDYDKTRELIIDPVLLYSTYLGGSNLEVTNGLTVDSSGNAYIVGATTSSDFPTTAGSFQVTLLGIANVFVTKINSAGSGLVYSTYLGGSNIDEGSAIAINTNREAYVVGLTTSPNFPVTSGAFQSSLLSPGGNVFVTKFDASGSTLLYSTYLGGSGSGGDVADAVAVDSSDNAYVAGNTSSVDFPTTAGVFQSAFTGTLDAFLAKFNPAGNLLYSTYLGGNGLQRANGIAVDSSESAYLTGSTNSPDFPTTSGAFQTNLLSGLANGYVTKFNSLATGIIYSTYLAGHSIDQGFAITLDTNNHAYVTGITSSLDFPTTVGAFQTAKTGGAAANNAFVTQFNSAGSALIYSTYLCGSMSSGILDASGKAIAVNSSGNVFITGSTNTTDFPTTADAFQSGFSDLTECTFITEFNPAGSALVYSTFFESDQGLGIALGSDNSFYVAGQVSTTNLPTTTGAFQTALAGSTDGFVAKFGVAIATPPTVTGISPNFGPTTGGTVVTITGTNFIGVTAVNFGGVPAAFFIVNSPTQITAVSPPGSGTVDVTVTNADGTSAISPADEFTYINEKLPTTTTLTILPNPAGEPSTFIATVAPSAATGTVTFFDNGIVIGTVPLVNGTASLTSSLSAGSHVISAVYSGDANFLPSSASVTINIPSPSSVFPPNDLKGFERSNQFATQTDIVNILTWKAPTQGNPPVAYRIYRNRELTRLIGVVSSHQKLQFVEHNRKKGKTYTYWVVSVDNFGNTSEPAVVTVHSRS